MTEGLSTIILGVVLVTLLFIAIELPLYLVVATGSHTPLLLYVVIGLGLLILKKEDG